MSDTTGTVSYPGLLDFLSFTYTASHGIESGKAVITVPANQDYLDNLEPFGDLTFEDDNQSVTLYNCALLTANIERGPDGYIGKVVIEDRRCFWTNKNGGGEISGHYNVRMPSGTNADEGFNSTASQTLGDATRIRQGTEKAPQDIAILCLKAMQETDYDVSALPNDSRPEIDWSYDNPAHCLQELCLGLGCWVTLNLDNDSVVIVTIGQGNPLPDNGQQQYVSIGVSSPVLPTSIEVVGGPTIFQGMIGLEAVGIDIDGSIKLIDDLTYVPDGGWEQCEPYFWLSIKNLQTRALVEKTLYKMWRITVPTAPTTPNVQLIDANGRVYQPDSIQEIFLYDRIIETHWDPNDPAKIIPKLPVIYGQFESGLAQVVKTSQLQQQGQNVAPNQYVDGIRVDADRWLIFTDDKLLYTDKEGYHPAKIGIKIAYSLRDPNTWEFIRQTKERQLDSQAQTGARIVHREEIFAKVIGSFENTPPWIFKTGTDNVQQDLINDQFNYWLDAAQQEYVLQESLDVPYVGIVNIQVDGLIQQVSWEIKTGKDGYTKTRASLATEHDPYVPPWIVRLQKIRAEHQREVAQQAPALARNFAARPGGF